MNTRALLAGLTLGVVAALASASDLRRRRIPDELIAFGLIAVVLLTPSLAASVAGGSLGFSSFLLVRFVCRGRMGLGDVKLATYFAAVLGARLWWLTVALACAAALLAIALRERIRGTSGDSSLPFAPFLSFGALAALLLHRLDPALLTGGLP